MSRNFRREQHAVTSSSSLGATSPGPLFKPLPTKRAFEEIADQIRGLIYSGTLKPGDKLPAERELAVQFRTGRMALREALRMLEQSGLVLIKQGSDGGAFVRAVDPGLASQSVSDAMRRADMSLEDLIAVRIALEDLVADLAVKRITTEELDVLEKTLGDAEAAIAKGTKEKGGVVDGELLAEINVDFHILLARATKNLLLQIITESMMNVMHLFYAANAQSAEFFTWHLSQHREILDAIRAKKVSRAKVLLKKHVYSLQKQFSALTGSGDLTSSRGTAVLCKTKKKP